MGERQPLGVGELRKKLLDFGLPANFYGHHVVVDDRVLLDLMSSVYRFRLCKFPRTLERGQTLSPMSMMDTKLYSLPARQTAVYRGIFSRSTDSVYTFEEINYVGVGLGFAHFHCYSRNDARIGPRIWNAVRYLNFGKPGEIFWSLFGYDAYPAVAARRSPVPVDARLHRSRRSRER